MKQKQTNNLKMNPKELEKFLKKNIPMASNMGISILSCNENSLISEAPLSLNKNDKGTGFAGSIFSLCALSGWSFIHSLTANKELDCDIMLHASEIEYLKPVPDDFTAEAKFKNPQNLNKFLDELESQEKSRAEISVIISCGNDCKAVFTGSYVAVTKY